MRFFTIVQNDYKNFIMRNYRLLAIETSCDETAAAVVEFGVRNNLPHDFVPLSNVVASQINLHKKFGGVYPELASRAHSQKIRQVVEKALVSSVVSRRSEVETTGDRRPATNPSIFLNKIDGIAVTTGPGLIGSLIVGVEFARGLAMSLNKPIVPVNHLEGHIYASIAGEITNNQGTITKQNQNQNDSESSLLTSHFSRKLAFPIMALVVSGGHTMLVLMRDHLRYEIIGTTLDDAAGECFDKVARMLGLPYPGGPALEKLARDGNPKAFDFPRSMINSKDYNFSFSGLKTAVFYKLRDLGLVDSNSGPLSRETLANFSALSSAKTIADIAASTQSAIIDVLTAKTFRAARDLGVKSILVGGGVSANSCLRQEFAKLNVKSQMLKVFQSPIKLATDNALSIAIAGAYHYARGDKGSWKDIDANSGLGL